MRRRNVLKAAGATALAGTTLAAAAPAGAAAPRGAADALLAAFSRHQVVAGMSPSHGLRDVDQFLLSLVRDPRLPHTVDAILAEGGNSRYQPLLDRYLAGDDVPLDEVRPVWSGTTQPGGGYSTFYERLYPLVRRVNQRLPAARRLRVLACDPPVDWSAVTSPDDFDAFLDQRDQSIASVLEDEVLARGRKALVLIGWGHVLHGRGAAAQLYEERYPGATYVVVNHEGFATDNDELERRMAPWPVPSLVPFRGSWLGALDSSYFSLPGDAPQPPGTGFPGADAYLYLGPRDLLLHEPLSAHAILDPAFLAEMRRRATAIQAPPDTPWYPEAVLAQEEQSSAFYYEPGR
jgi:hypothetical protein